MRYTKSALGLLNAQYRSVLKKCLMINLGLFALSAGTVKALPIEAPEDSVFHYEVGSENDYNFVMQEADDKGNITKTYYKIVPDANKFATSGNITWTEVSAAGNNVVKLTLPNNQTKLNMNIRRVAQDRLSAQDKIIYPVM